jgi:hypothetical protein
MELYSVAVSLSATLLIFMYALSTALYMRLLLCFIQQSRQTNYIEIEEDRASSCDDSLHDPDYEPDSCESSTNSDSESDSVKTDTSGK